MYSLDKQPIGIYEKAMPKNTSWAEKLNIAADAGYDFVEMSIDETDERLSRLDCNKNERLEILSNIIDSGVPINSLCLSGHRRFPMGSEDAATREKAFEIMKKAICLSVDLGIRNIQLAGYDVYYTAGNSRTRELFYQGLEKAVEWAARAEVMLSIEIMDHPFINCISRFMEINERISSPWLTVYPDIGNISAWGFDIEKEFTKGIDKISSIHLKETLAVSGVFQGQFKEVPFGTGCVDFRAFFKTLNKLKYKGPFLIEMWTEKAEDPIKEIKNARRWILEKMKEGGFDLC